MSYHIYRKEGILPNNLNGYHYINSQVVEDNYYPSFEKTSCAGDKYISIENDGRLVSSVRGSEKQILNRPPISSQISLSKIPFDKKLNNYGKNYKSYSDISAGNITYYVSEKTDPPFFNPIFDNSASIKGGLYKDPMDSVKPEYHRKPLIHNNVLITKKNSKMLSWIRDSNEHREDIISKQMAKRNREKYCAWLNL